MDFFNIGGGELLVIILLALVLFRPEDIYKAMRTLGRYTRSARSMWNEFSANIKQEMDTRELEEALAETKTLLSSAEDAVSTLKTSVADVKEAVEGDVSAAGRSLKAQAAEGAAALKSQTASAASAVSTVVGSASEAAAAIDSAAVTDANSLQLPAPVVSDPLTVPSESQGTPGPVSPEPDLALEPALGSNALPPEDDDADAPAIDGDAHGLSEAQGAAIATAGPASEEPGR